VLPLLERLEAGRGLTAESRNGAPASRRTGCYRRRLRPHPVNVSLPSRRLGLGGEAGDVGLGAVEPRRAHDRRREPVRHQKLGLGQGGVARGLRLDVHRETDVELGTVSAIIDFIFSM
jgi:hypothetical protein